MRGAALGLVLWAAGAGLAQAERVPVAQGEVIRATLIDPTDRYDHDILGSLPDWGGLVIKVNTCLECAGFIFADVVVTLPKTRVFEDVEARVADLDGDGRSEVIVVETDMARGATLAIYDATGKRASTKPVGQTHRWLAPAGIGDFDGDGRVEIAYVDRPHLAKELVFLRYADGTLTEIARAPGFANHRIGQEVISGGTLRCDGQDRLIVASGDWSRRLTVRLDGRRITAKDAGPLTGTDQWQPVCP